MDNLSEIFKPETRNPNYNHPNCFVQKYSKGQKYFTVGIYYGLSEADAINGFSYFRLTCLRPYAPEEQSAPELRIKSLRQSSLQLGDRCFNGSGILLPDLKPHGKSAESEIYFFLGNTVVMVGGNDPDESVLAIAKQLETRLKAH